MKWRTTKPTWRSSAESKEIILGKTTDNKVVLQSRLEAHRAMDKKEITQWALGEWEDRDDDLVRWMTEGTSPHMGPRSDCG